MWKNGDDDDYDDGDDGDACDHENLVLHAWQVIYLPLYRRIAGSVAYTTRETGN